MNRKWEVLRAMQNDFEVRELDGHARKNEIAIIKKIANTLFVVILLASVLIGMLAVIPEEVGAETWSIETVDSAGISHDISIALALDSNGFPHISYFDDNNEDLKYAKWTGSKWSITTVDSARKVGMYTSIALDKYDNPHISYFDMSKSDLKYAKWTGSKWSIETVDSDGSVGKYTSIALDSKGYPHVSYNDLDALKYAEWIGSKWSIETVDNITCTYISIALDSKGYPHISYFVKTIGALKYAKRTGSKWSIEIVDSGSLPFTSIALDSKGYPHISYFDDNNNVLKYAKWTGSKWSIETVDSAGNVGMYASLALDSNGNPHISYFDYTNKDLKYAKAGSKWSIETVDSAGDVGYDTSIALDSKGYLHISYFDTTNDVLKYAKLLFLKVPTQPRNLQATAGDGSVNLKWTAPRDEGGSPITNYRIYRDTTSGVGTLLTTVGKVLTYTDNDVTNDRTYYYQVSAENSIGKGAISDEASATPRSAITTSALTHIETTPSAPRNFIANAGDRVVNLNWNAPVDNGGSAITEYAIYRGTSSDAESYLCTVSAPTTSYIDRSVTNDQKYYYKVRAENSVGEGDMSKEVDAIPKSSLTQTTAPLVTTPSAPLNFKASAGDGNVNLEWTEPSDEGGSLITNYNIYRGTTPGGETLLKTVSNVLSYTDDIVINNQTYYYQVSAENSAGEGDMSIEVDAIPKSSLTETTAPLVKAPSAPLNFKASAGDGNVNLEWAEPSDEGGSPITNYNIYRGTTPGGETLRGSVSNVLNYTDDIVINNQTYYYQVSAENSAGEGNMSDEASATLIPGETVPSAPQDLNADRGDEYVDLSWNPPSNDGGSPITKYKVYRGMAPRGEEFAAEIDNAVNYRDYYVTNDQQYYYQVSAVNLPGEGEKSNEVEVDVEPKGDRLGMGVWITIIVALIGALGVIAAALINYLSSKKTK